MGEREYGRDWELWERQGIEGERELWERMKNCERDKELWQLGEIQKQH